MAPSRASTPPGLPSLAALLPLLFLVFTSTASAASAVLGIDLGTNFIKAAIVKPGTPLDIVLTKDSKRKETAAIAFKPAQNGPVELGTFPERLYGGDALALAGRFPGEVYSNLKPLLGIDGDDKDTVERYSSVYPAINVDRRKDDYLVTIKSGAFSDKEQPWLVEELLAMELRNIRTNAEAMTRGSKIRDAVITIPPYYTTDERKAVERAADLAGINVMALVSDGLAIGVDYAVKREFPNVSRGGKPEFHLVFDMGASSTTATVLKFQSRDVKDVGKFNKTIQEVQVAGAGWDRTLGGNALNTLVLDHLVSEFLKKPQASSAGITAEDVKKHGRTASKLWREAERARQVLSANSDVRSSFEGLYDDIDFASKLSRSQFEELAAPFAERVQDPIKQALETAEITSEDLTSVILHGGVVRTPFVQKRLESFFGKSTEIRSNVNADESAAFGAAFKAAGQSPSFRVKEIRDADAAIYDSGVKQQDDDKIRQQTIFYPTSVQGVNKHVIFKNKEDFEFSIFQEINNIVRSTEKIVTKNLTASVKQLNDKFGCIPEEVSTKFQMRLSPISGRPEVINGIVQCSFEANTKKGGLVDSVKGLFGGKKDQQPLKDEEASVSGSSSSTTSSVAASASLAANKTRDEGPTIRFESVMIDYTVTHEGNPQPSKEDLERIRERLAAFDRSDKARVGREEAFNTLESFTYKARDLLTDAGFERFSTKASRDQLKSLLSATSDWLYGEGVTATSDVLKGKLADFKALVDPVKKRQTEASDRPEKVKLLQGALDSTANLLENVSSQIAEAAKTVSASAASAAKSATSSAKDEIDDLEDPESASKTSSDDAGPSPMVPQYTEEDIADIKSTYESISAWLKEKLSAQEKLKQNEDPAFSLKEIEVRAKKLNDEMIKIISRKVQRPGREPYASKKKTSAKSKTKKVKSSASSAASSVSSGASSVASDASSAASSVASSASSKVTSAASAASDLPRKIKTLNTEDGKVPSEDEILEMIKEAGRTQSAEGEAEKHDEL